MPSERVQHAYGLIQKTLQQSGIIHGTSKQHQGSGESFNYRAATLAPFLTMRAQTRIRMDTQMYPSRRHGSKLGRLRLRPRQAMARTHTDRCREDHSPHPVHLPRYCCLMLQPADLIY